MSVSNDNKVIANAALNAFGGKPTIAKYWDDNKKSSLDILKCIDRPYDDVVSYSTIGLSEHSIGYTTDEVPLRVEVVGATASCFDCFPNVMASCAFNIINDSFSCSPGTIFKNVVKLYIPDSPMKHILFLPPFLWEGELKTLTLVDKKVAWLLAVPISDEELKYADEKGTEALEELFEEFQIDIFDLNRKSVK